MDDKTSQLLEKLAAKLGTTAEYLWSVLIRQAPIDATIGLIQFLGAVIFGFILWKIHKRLCLKVNKHNESLYEEFDIAAALPMVIGLITFVIWILASIFSIGNIISGYFNPEYWALKEIISSL